MRRTQGLTLVEVLVVIALLALLLGLIVQFFISQTRASSLQKGLNEANEATRTALSLVGWDLQNAGYEVVKSTATPALAPVAGIDNGGHLDALTIRLYDVNKILPDPPERKVRYDIKLGTGEIVTSLRRADFKNSESVPGDGMQPSVAGVVALNLLFETRADPFKTPLGIGSSKTCPSGITPVPPGATGADIQNCSVPWVWKDIPERLVRSVRLQVLGRSESRVPGRQSPSTSYSFAGADGTGVISENDSAYATEPGYVYHFAEQTVLAPNLGR